MNSSNNKSEKKHLSSMMAAVAMYSYDSPGGSSHFKPIEYKPINARGMSAKEMGTCKSKKSRKNRKRTKNSNIITVADKQKLVIIEDVEYKYFEISDQILYTSLNRFGSPIAYSFDGGENWIPVDIITRYFVNIIYYETMLIASTNNDSGLWHSSDNGLTWNQSNITTGSHYRLSVTGSTIRAFSNIDDSYRYSLDGICWKLL